MLPHVLHTAWRHARRHLGPTLFVGGGLASLAVALIAVGSPTWRAARMDPVEALRRE